MPLITVAHSPDSDDAFMHFALARHKIDVGDIETLNHKAQNGVYEVTALSIHAYALLSDKYALLNHGASMGEAGPNGYGPRVVAKTPLSLDELRKTRVAIPGLLTSAYLCLKLFAPEIETVEMPFDQILPAVASGEVPAGLLIHEGQLTYGDSGVQMILDLGVWWGKESGGLPLPLGGNAIRRDLGAELQKRVSFLLRASIAYALEHREEALDYALEFARGLETDRKRADEFVGMYVNKRTLDYGDDGRRAVQVFLDRGFEAGLIPKRATIEFVG